MAKHIMNYGLNKNNIKTIIKNNMNVKYEKEDIILKFLDKELDLKFTNLIIKEKGIDKYILLKEEVQEVLYEMGSINIFTALTYNGKFIKETLWTKEQIVVNFFDDINIDFNYKSVISIYNIINTTQYKTERHISSLFLN